MKKFTIFIVILIAILGGVYVFLNQLLFNSTFPLKEQQDFTVQNASNTKISLSGGEELDVLYDKKDDDLVFLYFHGNTGRIHYIVDFLAKNYSFVAPAYAGYQGSSGKPSVDNVYEMAEKMEEFIKQNFPNRKVYVFGHSLGSQPAFYFGQIGENIETLAFIGGFDSIFKMCQERMRHLKVFCVVALPSFDNARFLNKELPFTFIDFHNPNDAVVPLRRSIRFYDRVKAKEKFFIPLTEGDHANFNMKLITEDMIETKNL